MRTGLSLQKRARQWQPARARGKHEGDLTADAAAQSRIDLASENDVLELLIVQLRRRIH
jgi:hypothetical protein